MEDFTVGVMAAAERLTELAIQVPTAAVVEEISRLADEIWSQTERAELLMEKPISQIRDYL